MSGAAGGCAGRRLHRRLGYTPAEAPQMHAAAADQEEAGRTVGSKSRADVGVGELKAAHSQTAAAKLPGMNQQEPDFCSDPGPDPAPVHQVKVSPASAGTFSSSFSFIQQSLNSSQTTQTAPPQEPEPIIPPRGAHPPECPVQLPPSATSGGPTDGEDLPSCRRFWLSCPWDRRGDPPDPPDCDPVDIEVISSLSVDSDNASASSVTSGYESATPTWDQGWDSLLRGYEGVLQDCLQNNRTYTKVGQEPR